MASSIKYGFNAIIPAPIVNISKSYGRTGSQQKVGSVFHITLTGRVLQILLGYLAIRLQMKL
jgi:hypothetical protein